MCGQRISEMYFWVPQSGSMGIGISILSYAGQVFFGIIADESLIDDPQAVVDRFAPEFERLLLAVAVGALAGKERTSPEFTGEVGAKRRVTVRKKQPSPQPSPPGAGEASEATQIYLAVV